MRIYQDPVEAVREVERDLWEMGIDVHPQTMQDKYVADDEGFMTKEVRSYSFKISGWEFSVRDVRAVLKYFFPHDEQRIWDYCKAEFSDRIGGRPLNPGNAYKLRPEVWNDFIHDDKFAYTYSERLSCQIESLVHELTCCPESRQGILTIHSNICPMMSETPQGVNLVTTSKDVSNRGGSGRIPCSMYYQIMVREGKVDLIYTMRSCDFLTHFAVDIVLALMMQDYFADQLNRGFGSFTYFTGSLHAYRKDMQIREIF